MSDFETPAKPPQPSDDPENAAGATGPASFDLRRPDRVPKEQMEQIRFVHDTFARELSAALTGSLGVTATASVSGMEQVSYGELVNRLESPGCFLALRIDPMQAGGVLAFDAGLTFAAIELLLGSKPGEAPQLERELTEIEQNLLDLVFQTILENYGKAWSLLAPLDFRIEKMRQQPRQLDGIEQSEPVIFATLDVVLDTVTGKLRLGVPSLVPQMIWRGREQQQAEAAAGEAPIAAKDRMMQILGSVPLTLDVRLDGGSVLVRNFASLKPGDVLALGSPVDKPLDCLVNNKPKFKGRVSNNGSRIGFRIDGYE